MSTDPTERRAERRSVRKPRTPGPLARWIWNPRWIPGFVLAQVAVLLLFAEKSAGSFEGHGIIHSYEAFIRIVDSMVNQHAKWIKMSNELSWRHPIPSLNYLLTSHVWRQDHNGFTHQDPGFIDHLLNTAAFIVDGTVSLTAPRPSGRSGRCRRGTAAW
jgi:hypothetical protein